MLPQGDTGHRNSEAVCLRAESSLNDRWVVLLFFPLSGSLSTRNLWALFYNTTCQVVNSKQPPRAHVLVPATLEAGDMGHGLGVIACTVHITPYTSHLH